MNAERTVCDGFSRRLAAIDFIEAARKAAQEAVVLILCSLCMQLISACQTKQIELRGTRKLDFVELLVNAPLSETVTDVRKALAKGFRGLTLIERDHQIFPSDEGLKGGTTNNPALSRYLTKASELRENDFYLSGTGDLYWESEYYWNNQPVQFTCNFIVHLEPQGTAQTKIEVIEFVPQIWVGRKFQLLGRHGPDFYADKRIVAPTTKDRLDLLELLKREVRSAN